MTGIERRAFEEARSLEHSWTGAEHVLLAILTELPWLEIDRNRLAQSLAVLTLNGSKPQFDGSTHSNPRYHQVCGWAYGWAAAHGEGRPAAEDWLLAVLYVGDGMPESLLAQQGVSSGALVAMLREHGVVTPPFGPPEPERPWRGRRIVEVDRRDWPKVEKLLAERHPPGSHWRWGTNRVEANPDRYYVIAEDGIDLEGIVAEALA